MDRRILLSTFSAFSFASAFGARYNDEHRHSANSFRVMHNVLAEDHGATSFTALQIDAGSTNPTSYDIEGNDLVGATPIVAPLPTPAFQAGGLPPVMRNNRGALGEVGPKNVLVTSSVTIQNAGPLDCTYYFSAWSGSFASSTITLPGIPATSLSTGKPASVFLPVGAVFQAVLSAGTGSATYVGFCQP
jgi:hypothetical protein